MYYFFRVGICSSGFREIFFTMRTVKQWSGLLREALQSPSLEIFKTRQDKALINLVWSNNWSYVVSSINLWKLKFQRPYLEKAWCIKYPTVLYQSPLATISWDWENILKWLDSQWLQNDLSHLGAKRWAASEKSTWSDCKMPLLLHHVIVVFTQ